MTVWGVVSGYLGMVVFVAGWITLPGLWRRWRVRFTSLDTHVDRALRGLGDEAVQLHRARQAGTVVPMPRRNVGGAA